MQSFCGMRPTNTTAKSGIDHAEIGMIDIADVPLFVAVARSGSFVAASRRTKTPPSTVSRAIARLEQALGVRLFERTTRRVTLTRAGLELLERAGRLTDELSSVLGDVSSRERSPAGLVRVTAPVWTGGSRVAASLVAFAARYPRIVVDLHVSNTVVDLVESGFDLALRTGPITDESFIARRLWDVPFALAASEDFVRRVLRGKRRLTRERLESLPAVTTGAPWRLRAPDGSQIEIVPAERFRVDDPRVAIEAARAGLGVVRAPLQAVVDAGLVQLGCVDGDPMPRTVYAVYPSSKLLPARVRLVVDWLAKDGAARRERPGDEGGGRAERNPVRGAPKRGATTTAAARR